MSVRSLTGCQDAYDTDCLHVPCIETVALWCTAAGLHITGGYPTSGFGSTVGSAAWDRDAASRSSAPAGSPFSGVGALLIRVQLPHSIDEPPHAVQQNL